MENKEFTEKDLLFAIRIAFIIWPSALTKSLLLKNDQFA
jgi:hypothetical protein